MSACQKCWSDAHASDDIASRYIELINERVDDPCTPEEKAGPSALRCPCCTRKTLHEITQECMNDDCDND